MEKITPRLVVSHLWKKVHNFFLSKTKSLQLTCADFQTVHVKFFKINESRDISTVDDFKFGKIVLHNQIINKMQTAKNQENPTPSWRKLPDNHLVKFL